MHPSKKHLDSHHDDSVEVEGNAAEVDLPVLRWRIIISTARLHSHAQKKSRSTHKVVLSATDRLLGALNITCAGHRDRDAVESEETIDVQKG